MSRCRCGRKVCVEVRDRVFGWRNWEGKQTSGQSICGTRLESGTTRLDRVLLSPHCHLFEKKIVYFICGFINDAVSSADCTASSDKGKKVNMSLCLIN
jgi:hypothetical protein